MDPHLSATDADLSLSLSLCAPLFCRHEAQIRNDRGNLPLHSATSFRAPIEVAGECHIEVLPVMCTPSSSVGTLRSDPIFVACHK